MSDPSSEPIGFPVFNNGSHLLPVVRIGQEVDELIKLDYVLTIYFSTGRRRGSGNTTTSTEIVAKGSCNNRNHSLFR